ncbi:hypothetical protein M9434_005503 [Picochlorum sp. BPE23]|nr:hypothetical protein M9434_005503 [Picochlorum sp. BPE23]KAI8103248.1 hypothetical protein M9435_004588 [Picochlorum sp. BPE23]
MWPSRPYNRDTLLGLAKGTLIVVYRKKVLFYSHILGIKLYDFIVNQLIWFETAKPAGIKLHVGLSQALSQVGLGYTQAVRKIVIYFGERGLFDAYLLSLGALFFAVGSRRGHACLLETLQVFHILVSLNISTLALIKEFAVQNYYCSSHETLVNKAIVLMQGFIQSHMQTAEHLHSEKVFRKESNISGARYHLVTTYSGTASCCPNHADRPKSQIFRSQVEFKSKFEGFKSR